MSGGDGFTNIRRGAADFHTSHAPSKHDRPSSSTTAATASSSSSSSDQAPSAPTPRMPAWKLREAAKRSGSPPKRIPPTQQPLKPKMTMEVGTSTPSGRRRTTLSVLDPPYPLPPRATGLGTAHMALPYLNDNQQDEASIRSAARSSVRSRYRSEPSSRAASREPPSRGRRSPSKERSSTAASRSSSVSRRNIRCSSQNQTPRRSSSQERRGTRSSSKDRRSTRSSSKEPSRRKSSRESRGRIHSSSQERSRAASRDRIASHSAVAEGSARRRGMRKSELPAQDEAATAHDAAAPSQSWPEDAHELLEANEEKQCPDASAAKPQIAVSPIKPEPTKVVIESCQDSFDFGGFPSTYSFDNDDPFKSSFFHGDKVEPTGPPLTRKPSKNVESVVSRKSSSEHDDLSSVPSMFQAAMEYGKKTKKKTKKTTSKSKKSRSDDDPSKSKKKKTKKSEPDTPATTKTRKTTTKKSKTHKEESAKKEEPGRNDNGFDWEVPITPVFETPIAIAPKKKLSSKEDIYELCKRDKESTDAFHNSLDNLFELPAGLMSPIAKATINEKNQPVIHVPDDASHASDVSSICDISERSDDDGIPEPQTPRTQRRSMGTDGSIRSHRTSISKETSNTYGTCRSAATSATAWQLREQQKHARRPAGRRARSIQAPQTVPSRPRRAMTTHLKHQQCPLPPAFAALSAPSTPKTPAMNKRLMSNQERSLQNRLSNDRKGSIADSLLYFSGKNDDASIEPDLLSTCSRSVYSTRDQNLQKFNKQPSTKQFAIPQNAKLETNPVTGKQQLVVDLGDVPAAFRTSIRSLQSTHTRRRD